MSVQGSITHDVSRVADIVNNRGVVGIPTETVYGLAARADYEDSVRRVFDIKGRPHDHPLIAHLAPTADYSEWGFFNESALLLAEVFWPGPLTLLVPRTSRVKDWVTGGRNTVALRVPSLGVTQQLLALINDAVVAPSANRFGKVSPTTAQHVANDLGVDVDIILDGGPCSVGVESTIVECIGETIKILRPGFISARQVSDVCGIAISSEPGESRAPGMLNSHYAPIAKVVLVQSLAEAQEKAALLSESDGRWAILHYDDSLEYATHMYDLLRRFDEDLVSIVFATLPQDDHMGMAIQDRLRKAAYRQ